MEGVSSTSLVCSADVAAFVDALETINCSETEVAYDPSESVVICISDTTNQAQTQETIEEPMTIEEEASPDGNLRSFNPDSRKLKAIMQQLVASERAVIVKKKLTRGKGNKQYKSDVWNWFGDVCLLISEEDANRLKIPFYTCQVGNEVMMICKVFVGCFKCSALFMYDAQRHSTSTLRYHVRACTRPKECIFVSEDKIDDENSSPENEVEMSKSSLEKNNINPVTGKVKRFRTDPRKQKEVIEQLFQKQKAVVTRKSFMNMKGNRRFKSDVWNWFGDIKLLISRSEAKKLKIPYYIRRCGDEQMVLSKIFVGCFKCLALFIHDSQKSTSTLRYHIRTCSRPKERKKRNTPNIIFFPTTKLPKQPMAFADSDAILAHEKLLNFALSTESSMEVIKDPEFQKILQMCITVGALYGDVNVDSLLCPTPTLTNFILNDLYVTSVNSFYSEFQHAYGATYGLNIWIDEQFKTPFISIFCNYASAEGELKSVVVHTDEFDYDVKTAENVRDWFRSFMNDQPVVPYKKLMIIDNESNLVSAFRDEPAIKCCAQSLNSILQAVCSKAVNLTNSELPDFTNLLSNCVDIADYFEQISDQYKLPNVLVRCQDDNWMSILSLFRSVDSQYENILNVLNETGATHLLSAEKSTINSVAEFLGVFEDAIMQLSSTSEPTLNLVIPWVAKLQKLCSTEREEMVVIKQLKNHITLEMNERIIKNITIFHRMATYLDPRFKRLIFGPQSEHREANIKLKCLVKECVECPNMEDVSDPKKSAGADGLVELYTGFDCNKSDKSALEEVEKYNSETFTLAGEELRNQNKFPVLRYWAQHADIYPYLSKVASWILTCPASVIQDSGTFWKNNWLVNCPRLPLHTDNVNKVLFVKSYKGLWNL